MSPLIEYPAMAVYTAATWYDLTEPTWVERPTLRLVNAVKCCAPEMPSATIQQWYGTTNEADRAEFAAVSVDDLIGHYVRIVVGDDAWYGLIVGTVDAELGGGAEVPAGQRMLQCYGLAHLLARQSVHGAMTFHETRGIREIDRGIRFNRTYDRGIGDFGGNCYMNDAGSWYFVADDFALRTTWSVAAAIEYCLQHYSFGPIATDLFGDVGDLAEGTGLYGEPVAPLDPVGMSVFQVLNNLLDRRRGYTWSIRFSTDLYEPGGALTPYVHVHSIAPAVVSADDVEIPANGDQGDVDLAAGALQRIYPETSSETLADTIRVIGAPIRVVCTVGQNAPEHDGESIPAISNGWTEAEAIAMRAGASGEDGYAADAMVEKMQANDDVRAGDALRHVFSLFSLSSDDWEDLIGGINIFIGNDETFQVNGVPVVGATTWLDWRRPLLRALPLKEQAAYDDEDWPSLVDYSQPDRAPVVCILCADGIWRYADDLGEYGLPNATVSIDDRGPGLRVRFSPSVLFAGESEWADAEPGGWAPAFGQIRTFVATIAFELDECLRVVKRIVGNDHADYTREIVIRVPDARLDLAWKHCAVGIDATGALLWLHMDADMTAAIVDETSGQAVGITLRDDSRRLRAIALAAAEWYGRTRATAKFTVSGMSDLALPGKYVLNLNADDQEIAINGVITRQTWDAKACVTTLETGWFDVAWAQVAGPNLPGVADHGAQARDLTSRLARLEAGRQEGD